MNNIVLWEPPLEHNDDLADLFEEAGMGAMPGTEARMYLTNANEKTEALAESRGLEVYRVNFSPAAIREVLQRLDGEINFWNINKAKHFLFEASQENR